MPTDINSSSSLPSPWAGFLDEVDTFLSRPVELHCLGGFVLTALYGLPRPTGDIDYIAAVPGDEIEALQEIAGPSSTLARKYRVHVQYVTVAEVPEEYETRLVEIFPHRFSHLRLRALDPHDIVLSKITRNSPVDDADVGFLATTGAVDPSVLWDRYQRELRPRLGNQERHDLTLRLWLEAHFQG